MAGAAHQEALHQGSQAQALHLQQMQQDAQRSPPREFQAASSFAQASAQQACNNQADLAAEPVDWQQNALYASDMPAYPPPQSPAAVEAGVFSQLGFSQRGCTIATPTTAPTAAPTGAPTAAPTEGAEANLINCHQPAELLTAAHQQAADLLTAGPEASVTQGTAGRHAAGASLSPVPLKQTVPVSQHGISQQQHEPAAAMQASLKQTVPVSQANMTQQQHEPAAAIPGSAQTSSTDAVSASSQPQALCSLPGLSLGEAEPPLQLIDRLQAARALAAPSPAVAACEEPVLSQADLVTVSEGRNTADSTQAHTLDQQQQVCRTSKGC